MARLAEGVADPADPQVEDLQEGEEQAEEGHHVHHQQEDGLLRGPRHEAVHRVRARRARAHVGGDHLEAVQDVLAEQEGHLEGRAPQQLADVDLHQAVTHDPPPAVVLHLCTFKQNPRVRAGSGSHRTHGLERARVHTEQNTRVRAGSGSHRTEHTG